MTSFHFNYNCSQTVSNPEKPLDDDRLNPSEDQKTRYFLRNARQSKSNEEQQKKDNLQRHLVYDNIVKFCTGCCALDVANQIMNIRCLKVSIWSLFMLEMQESAKYMACKS